MRKLLLILCLGLGLSSPALAQLTITVKKASSNVTSTTTAVTTDTTQVLAADGSEIGGAIKVERSPVINSVTAAKPVGVIFLDVSPRSFDGLLVRIKSKTAKAILVEPGVYQVAEPGKHEFSVMVFGSNPMALDEDDVTVEVGGTPGPVPWPQPPTPVGPSPIEGAGLRVLFVSETGERLDRAVDASFYSPEIAAYLNANCIKVDGNPDFRRVDPGTPFTDTNHRFAKALARPRASLPWMIVSNGTGGYEGPFPATPAETLALIKSLQPAPQATKCIVTIFTLNPCPVCDRWKALEKPRISNADFREVEDATRMYSAYPTFILERGSRRTNLQGYQTAEQIIKALEGL